MRAVVPLRASVLAILLAVAAATTVAIGWVSALLHDPASRLGTSGVSASAPPRWVIVRWETLTATRIASHRTAAPDEGGSLGLVVSPSWSRTAMIPSEHASAGDIEDARGWPFRSLRSKVRYKYAFTPEWNIDAKLEVHGGIRVGPLPWTDHHTGEYRVLPVRPIVGGFAANTCIFWGVGVVAAALVSYSTKVSRRRRGSCESCGHSLRGGDGFRCAECGLDRGGQPTSGLREAI